MKGGFVDLPQGARNSDAAPLARARSVMLGVFAMPTLRDVLNSRPKDRVIAAPGVYDMVSLRMAARMGFDALYMTGYGTVASHLGLPDAGLASYADMVGRVELMAQMSDAPLIADGDTGYGGLLNVRHTVRGYERAGAPRSSSRTRSFQEMRSYTGSTGRFARRHGPKDCGGRRSAREPAIPCDSPDRRPNLARSCRGDPPRESSTRLRARTCCWSNRLRLRKRWPRSAESSGTSR